MSTPPQYSHDDKEPLINVDKFIHIEIKNHATSLDIIAAIAQALKIKDVPTFRVAKKKDDTSTPPQRSDTNDYPGKTLGGAPPLVGAPKLTPEPAGNTSTASGAGSSDVNLQVGDAIAFVVRTEGWP